MMSQEGRPANLLIAAWHPPAPIRRSVCWSLHHRRAGANAHQTRVASGGAERLGPVLKQVLNVFQPHRESDQSIANAHSFPVLPGHRGMAHGGRILGKRTDPTKRFGEGDYPGPFEEMLDGLNPALQFK